MQFNLPTKTKSISFSFLLQSTENQRVKIIAFDASRNKRVFTERFIQLTAGQSRRLQLKFPTTPEMLVIQIGKEGSGSDSSLKVSNETVTPLQQCAGLTITSHTAEFVHFALTFAYNINYMPSGTFQSNNKRFTILLKDTIRDPQGKSMNTPARVQHNSGIIEVAKDKFSTYTIPQMFLILMHEYSHKWLNQQMGKRIDDEVAADLNALRIYLGLGYPHIDARLVFCYVFYKKETPQNIERLQLIEEFITKFEQGKIIPLCK